MGSAHQQRAGRPRMRVMPAVGAGDTTSSSSAVAAAVAERRLTPAAAAHSSGRGQHQNNNKSCEENKKSITHVEAVKLSAIFFFNQSVKYKNVRQKNLRKKLGFVARNVGRGGNVQTFCPAHCFTQQHFSISVRGVGRALMPQNRFFTSQAKTCVTLMGFPYYLEYKYICYYNFFQCTSL
jgi:hypothetical protein